MIKLNSKTNKYRLFRDLFGNQGFSGIPVIIRGKNKDPFKQF